MQRALSPVSAVLGLVACQAESVPTLPADTPFPVTIEVVRSPVARGDSPGFVLSNQSTVDLGYNLCMDGILERRTPTGWVAIYPPPNPCPAILFELQAGTTRTVEFGTSLAPSAGEYRLRVRFSFIYDTGRVVRRSGAFALQ